MVYTQLFDNRDHIIIYKALAGKGLTASTQCNDKTIYLKNIYSTF